MTLTLTSSYAYLVPPAVPTGMLAGAVDLLVGLVIVDRPRGGEDLFLLPELPGVGHRLAADVDIVGVVELFPEVPAQFDEGPSRGG